MSIKLPENIKKVIIDGANIAFTTRNSKNKADIQNLVVLQEELNRLKLVREDLDWIIICDASLRFAISDRKLYEKWARQGIISQSPSRMKADIFILQMMHKFDGEIAVISNDLFSEYGEQLDDVVHRYQLGFIIAFEQFFVEEIKVKRAKLKKFSNFAEPVEQRAINLSSV